MHPCQRRESFGNRVSSPGRFARKGEVLTQDLNATVSVIWISKQKRGIYSDVQPPIIAELKAFGVRLGDSKPRLPEDGKLVENNYMVSL